MKLKKLKIKSDNVENILLIKLSSLGDIVLATAGMQALKKLFPKSKLTIIVEKPFKDITELIPQVDETLIFDRKGLNKPAHTPEGKQARKDFKELRKSLRRRKFDIAVDMQGLARSAFFLYRAKAKVKIGLGRFPFIKAKLAHDKTKQSHAVDRYLLLTSILGDVEGPAIFPELVIPETVKDDTENLLNSLNYSEDKKLVVLIHSSRWKTKTYPIDYQTDLVKKLQNDKRILLVLAGGKGEIKNSREIINKAGITSVNDITGETSLTLLAGILKRADLVITPDSGPMHMAVASGSNVLAIFGPTSVIATGPYGSEPDKISILQTDLDCQPCFKRKCKLNSQICMLDIPAQNVYNKAIDILFEQN